MQKFWNWIRDADGGRTLRLEGPIDEDSLWGDEVTPKAFREELYEDQDDITLWINSPGGSVFAGAEIYTMIRDYPGRVTVKIASIAASAASVVAMAGDAVFMSPTALLFVHDPMTIAMGNVKDMEKAIKTLKEVKESIINAYMAKTGMRHNKIAELMENETWINAKKAVELGFADGILFVNEEIHESGDDPEGGDENDEAKEEKDITLSNFWNKQGSLFSTKRMGEAILNQIGYFPEDADKSAAGKQKKEHTEEGMMNPKDTIADGGSNEGDQKEGMTGTDISKDVAKQGDCIPSIHNDVPPIIIGMDGTTADGSVPYEILKRQLAFLK